MRVILKFAVAGAVLLSGWAAAAAPRNDDCADCAPPSRYDSEAVIEKIRNAEHSRVTGSSEAKRGSETRRVHRPRTDDCANCPPPRKYDSQEVVRKVHNVDHSRVINTVTVVPASRRVRETNHLIVHKNEIRNLGVIQHNRIIVEKETRYVRRIPIETRVEIITRNYRVVERPDSITIEVAPRRVRDCTHSRAYGRYGSCRPVLRVRG